MTEPDRSFSANVVAAVDGAALVTTQGELDLCTAGEFRACLVQCLEDGCQDISIDMSELRFLDSSGIGVLIGVMRHVTPQGGGIRIVEPSPAARKALDLTGLSTLIQMSESATDL